VELFNDVLAAPRARHRGYFDERFVAALVREHTSGRRDHTARLWLLLVLELWQRAYVDAQAYAAGPAPADQPVRVA
jgi:asparagine synthase (glutamine-hydrolysing)